MEKHCVGIDVSMDFLDCCFGTSDSFQNQKFGKSKKFGNNQEGFKELYNSTIYGYLLDKKLEFALHKLEENKLKVKDIAFEIGYENPSHFISAFKKKYSLTPKQYVKRFQ